MPGPRAFQFTDRWPELAKLFPEPLSPELIELLDRRDRDLEDHLNNQPVIWCRDASVAVFRSMPWTAKTYTKVRSFAVEVGQDDAGTDEVQGSATVFELHVDGVNTASLTLPASAVYAEYEGRLPDLTPGSRVTIYSEDVGFTAIATVGF